MKVNKILVEASKDVKRCWKLSGDLALDLCFVEFCRSRCTVEVNSTVHRGNADIIFHLIQFSSTFQIIFFSLCVCYCRGRFKKFRGNQLSKSLSYTDPFSNCQSYQFTGKDEIIFGIPCGQSGSNTDPELAPDNETEFRTETNLHYENTFPQPDTIDIQHWNC